MVIYKNKKTNPRLAKYPKKVIQSADFFTRIFLLEKAFKAPSGRELSSIFETEGECVTQIKQLQ